MIELPYVWKYKMQSAAKAILPWKSLSCGPIIRNKKKVVTTFRRKKMIRVREAVARFFEDDYVSSFSPAKNDSIVRKKLKKQKRFLTNTLKYLYKKFSENISFVVSYATFCKLCPFWVLY